MPSKDEKTPAVLPKQKEIFVMDWLGQQENRQNFFSSSVARE